MLARSVGRSERVGSERSFVAAANGTVRGGGCAAFFWCAAGTRAALCAHSRRKVVFSLVASSNRPLRFLGGAKMNREQQRVRGAVTVEPEPNDIVGCYCFCFLQRLSCIFVSTRKTFPYTKHINHGDFALDRQNLVAAVSTT